MKRLILVLFALTLAGPAFAQAKKPLAITGNPLQDLKTDIQNGQAGAAAINNGTALPTCDFNIFVALTPQNVIGTLQACGQKLLDDTQAALTSAQAAKVATAVACLGPALPLIQASIGTPAVPATATTPEVPAVLPGPVLAFEKFTEFVNAGAIPACKSWVQNTINAVTSNAL